MATSQHVASNSQQFRAVLKKNWLLKARNPGQTALEIFFSVYMVGILVLVAPLNQSPTYFDPSPLPAVSESCAVQGVGLDHCLVLGFAPNASAPVRDVMATVADTLGLEADHVLGFQDDASIESYYQDGKSRLGFAVVFNVSDTDVILPGDLAYDIRVNASVLFAEHANDAFADSGYVLLQHTINMALATRRRAELGYGPLAAFNTTLVPLPNSPEQASVRVLWPYYVIFASMPAFQIMIVALVTEKKEKIVEGMRMMGMGNTPYYASWFVSQAVILGLASVTVIALVYVTGTFQQTDPLLLFLALMLFQLTLIPLAFIITTFVKDPGTGSSVGAAGFLLSLFSFAAGSVWIFPKPDRHQWAPLLSLACPAPFGQIIDTMAKLESLNTGLTWDNLRGADVDYPIDLLLVFLLVDCFLYSLAAWYVQQVHPGEYGTALPLSFPFSAAYWRGDVLATEKTTRTAAAAGDANDVPEAAIDPLDGAGRSEGDKVVRVKDLVKRFPDGKLAVAGLSLDLYQNEILALLGHNGAGKTTTIGMLSGLFAPSSGDAVIFGNSIRTNAGMRNIHSQLGVCPQHEILFPDLTALEHLRLYGALKGMSPDRIETEAHQMLTDVALDGRGNERTATFSGGMKRKLSIAIALMGDSKFVMLDEPSSGMDPFSRKQVWALLQRVKRGRCIVLTTHSMEEADLLGDRIAIMAQGSLRTLGSSSFLKNKYGIGYHLNIVVPSRTPDTEPAAVLQRVQAVVPSAKLVDQTSAHTNDVSVILPLDQAKVFPKLFRNLDSWKSIDGYGVSMTTLEEVFLQLAAREEELIEQQKLKRGTKKSKK